VPRDKNTLQVLANFGVMRVISSGHPDFKAGDLVWGITGWEEYTVINNPESLFRINHPKLPLSYYTGILGEFIVPALTCSCHKQIFICNAW
jgi:NADPH-dependent curcumin reductase CurA